MDHVKTGLAGYWLIAWPTLATAQAAGDGGGSAIVSLIVPMALIVGIVWLIVRLIRRGRGGGGKL